jgi:uncharacterized protein YjiK
MTQYEKALKGEVTPAMYTAAQHECVAPERVRYELAGGTAVIPCNPAHAGLKAVVVGENALGVQSGIFVMLLVLMTPIAGCDSNDTSQDGKATSTTNGIGRYALKMGPIKMGDKVNCSGITFNPESKSLFVVANSPTEIYELGMDGKIKRTIALTGFDDTEDIAFVSKRTFGILEEERGNFCLVDIDSNTTSVAYKSAVKFLVDAVGDNVGLEGVAYDPIQDRFFVVKEKSPRRIYAFKRPTTGRASAITKPWDIEAVYFGCKDLSGVFCHTGAGHLLILSDESKCVVEATLNGKEIARLSLKAGSAGLNASVPQPEGITMDEEGDLYICSEPNLLYVFSKTK